MAILRNQITGARQVDTQGPQGGKDHTLRRTYNQQQIHLVAGETAGKIMQTIRIETDLAGSEPELTAYAEVGSE